jgi:type II secretory pathway pseudopilin PulG
MKNQSGQKQLLARHPSSFTLIELLVFVVILGFLLTIGFVALENAKRKARDAQRIANINQFRKALDLYFNSQQSYPQGTDLELGSTNARVLCSGSLAAGFQAALSDCGNDPIIYIDHIPQAPGMDADCPSGQDRYLYTGGDDNYVIAFCLGREIEGVGPGACQATPEGITCL